MLDARITPSGLWVAVMLTFLLGAVLRIFAGDFVAGKPAGQAMWLLTAVIMVIPILMVVLARVLPQPWGWRLPAPARLMPTYRWPS